MQINQINPEDAYNKMQKDNAVYIDVRTEKEFNEGHAVGACNIPIFTQLQPEAILNPEFVSLIENKFDKGSYLLLGCRTGGRSQKACEMLEQAGFMNLFNIQGGFIGTDTNQGWSSLGLPSE